MNDFRMLEMTYLGNACFGVRSENSAVLVDPYISENEQCPYSVEEVMTELDDFDAVCVTHLAYDHLGDCTRLATEYDMPVITEPATKEYLISKGVHKNRIKKLVWGLEAKIDDLIVRALKTDHVSTGSVDGEFLTGLPLSYLISDGETTAYHMGDTALFGDLQMIGEMHSPDVTMIGVGQGHIEEPGPTGIQRITREMTPDEAAVAAEWVDGDVTIPMHYEGDERTVFEHELANRDVDTDVAPLEPGESVTVE